MPRANRRDLSFATFNLLNFQAIGGLTYSNTPPFADDAEGRAAFDRKVDWIAEKLVEIDAEVIGFQELWSAGALHLAFQRAGLDGHYDLIARDAPGRGRPQVALAVRKGEDGLSQLLPNAAYHSDFPSDFRFDCLRESRGAEEEITVTISKFSRPVIMAQIQPTGTRPKPPVVTVLVAHLKSKAPARLSRVGDPPVLSIYPTITKSAVAHIRRVMEAGALRALLDGIMKADDPAELTPTVVLGDLNDGSLSVSTELIAAQPGYRVIEKSRTGNRSDAGLYSVEKLQQYRSLRHVYYTHIYKNQMESLDHILVSEEFYDHARKRHWSFREMEILNDHLNHETKPELRKSGASDHGIVRAYFDWNPIPQNLTG